MKKLIKRCNKNIDKSDGQSVKKFLLKGPVYRNVKYYEFLKFLIHFPRLILVRSTWQYFCVCAKRRQQLHPAGVRIFGLTSIIVLNNEMRLGILVAKDFSSTVHV